jgi:glyoxylase-like metal-dependent hydrolase (beta-lactamase superfamily II)
MSEYSGHVSPGGPAEKRTLAELEVTKFSVGPHDNNVYLLRCRKTGEQLLIDAAADPARILEVVGPKGVATIVTTHSHSDHWGALAEVAAATGAELLAHAVDAPDIPVHQSRLTAEGETVAVGECALEVIHLAGHTPGGIALLYRDPQGPPHLFTADSLFPGGVGNTGNDPARFKSLMTDVTTKVFDQLPDHTWVYPGHGDDTTLGRERSSLPDWWARGW